MAYIPAHKRPLPTPELLAPQFWKQGMHTVFSADTRPTAPAAARGGRPGTFPGRGKGYRGISGTSGMGYVPPHKWHSKESERPLLTSELRAQRFKKNLYAKPYNKSNVDWTGRIAFADHSTYRWCAAAARGGRPGTLHSRGKGYRGFRGGISARSGMAHIPPHKRHSKEYERPLLTSELHAQRFKKNLYVKPYNKSNVDWTGRIAHADHSTYRWCAVGLGEKNQFPPSVNLKPICLYSTEPKVEENRLALFNTSLDDEGSELKWNSPRSPGVSIAENVLADLVSSIKHMRNEMKCAQLKEGKPTLLARVGKVLFLRTLFGNRLMGSIPKELGDITTLKNLDISFNNFSGRLPQELGSWANIERMLLSSNNFTGELPETFAMLTKIKDFRVSDSHFSGQIPDFIEKWTSLKRLLIQASGLTGPIPSGISLLTSLNDLRITDLSGPESPIPLLDKMRNMKTLMLRSCNLVGRLPPYLGQLAKLKTLDLSFNKLTGEIPSSFASLAKVDYIFLTGNLLTGPIPTWPKDVVDLSYNNLTIGDGGCLPPGGMNLFASSSKDNSSRIVSCFRTAQCPPYLYYSLRINCGGTEFTVPGETNTSYDRDTSNSAGPSSFYQSTTNWALSNTGYFTDDDQTMDTLIVNNKTRLYMANPQLYMNARLSPISLTYFGFCLGNGNYTVNLHFAEIMFRNGRTHKSLGRRIFDIYIQGKLVKKDFNIMDEADVFGDVVIKNFTAPVTNNTLEIRLYWAGKGTTGVPVRGIYGPLISAISVDPNFDPPPKPVSDTSTGRSGSGVPVGGSGMHVGAVVGIVVGGVFIILLIFGILWKRGLLGQQKTLEDDLKGVDLQTGKFTFKQLKDATSNFNKANKIGEGGFGSVYKGVLADGTAIAVKQLSSKSKQGNREFVNEIGMISALQHPHLVKLHGCCIEGNQLLLVYEYLENNSVAHAFFRAEESHLKLDWPTRHKICIGTARGLAYLHEESRLKVVHRDIKATNVLLDKNLNPKISDFGLAKLDEEDNTHISTRIAGTYGYMAPEYAMRGYLTDKADVYSFGILVLEIVSGRNNTTYWKKEESFYLLDWARLLKKHGNLMDLVDPRLELDFNKEEMTVAINVALLCCNVTSTARPTMSSVVSMLEGRAVVQELVSDPKAESIEIDAMRKHFQSSFGRGTSEKWIETRSIERSWTASSASAHDLYPINPDSD